VFENNDLPGVFGIRALDRLVCGYRVLPGEPVVLQGDSESALRLAELLAEQGVALAGVVTRRRSDERIDRLRQRNVPVHYDRRPIRACGGRWLDRLEFAPDGTDTADLVLDCQVYAVELSAGPAYELAHHAGCRVFFQSESGYLVSTNREGQTSHSHAFAAGHCAGATTTGEASLQGRRAGLACALSLKEDRQASEQLKSLIGRIESLTAG
jgi:sarcosine oxidase subunit alpha